MAAIIREATGQEVEITPGGRGEFTVWVGERKVAAKDHRGFPDEQEVVQAVRRALAVS